MEFFAFMKLAWPIIVAYGPASIGWIVAAGLAWFIVKKREQLSDTVIESNNKLIETKDKYIVQVHEMNAKLAELNGKHVQIVSELNDARIEDLKELTADYNKLANDTLRTMDKFVVALETSNNLRKK